MYLVEQLVTLDKNDLKDITFEGWSIYHIQEIIQDIGLYNENIGVVNSFTGFGEIEFVNLPIYHEIELEKYKDLLLYEEVFTLDFEVNNGIIVHINK